MRLWGLGAAILAVAMLTAPARAQVADADVTAAVQQVMPRVIAWRRDIHAHPELGNREARTATLIAAELRRLGMEVRTGVARTGVVGVLRGGQPGPVIALRSEMDALPVEEATGLSFASHVTAEYNGATVHVAHACGHDMHIAMLLGAANVLAGMRDRLPGTIVFIFQPAEEGPPQGERGGADVMIEQGALANPAPSAIFGLHVVPGMPGTIFYRPGGFMAGADEIHINLHGKQTHGAWPWLGVDSISLASSITEQLNTLAARNVDVTRTPTVLSITAINGGNRWNIIPKDVAMLGTLRTFDDTQRAAMQQRITQTVQNLATNYGATADVQFISHGPVTNNDPRLAAWALPALQEAAGAADKVDPAHAPVMVSEDFSYYQQHIPGLFVHLGASADGVDPATSPPNHSPEFSPNEAVLPLGVRTHALVAIRYLESGGLPPH
ncbi:MAG TPA: amidohydrolase [Caulobacterales bacterium]|nr:amidohydrolase [Caulobacterales bacterium]